MKKGELMKLKTSLFITTLSLTVSFLAGCSNSSNVPTGPKSYHIGFYNYDSTLLYETDVLEGVMPSYSGQVPTKPSDASSNYRFAGWDPTLAVASKDQNYTAIYTSSNRTYNVTIGDNIPYATEYGSTISNPGDLSGYLEDEYYYSFAGWYIDNTDTKWNFDTDTIKSETKLVAKFEKSKAIKATFKNYNGDILEEVYCGSGYAPTYTKDEPTKDSTVSTTYTFASWEPAVAPISEDITYVAKFNENVRNYKVTFKNENGTIIKTLEFAYGSTPSYDGTDPIKQSDSTYKYTFKGWDKDFSTVESDQTYTATFKKSYLNSSDVIIRQYVEGISTPVYEDTIEYADGQYYTVAEEYRSLKANGYDASEYRLVPSEIVDLYLIAGQSNAAGYSGVSYLDADTILEYPESSVAYYGNADGNSFKNFNTNVSFGLGPSSNHFGAEVGMAKVIEASNPNANSCIVKCAYGGTYLYDEQTYDVSKTWGNWCSPSAQTSSANADITGVCYDNFINNIQAAIDHYKELGYTVRLGGTFWMQGEAESGQAYSGQYGDMLEKLINDLRSDYSSMFDLDGATAPFVVGMISETFAGGGLGIDNVRSEEQRIANKLDNVIALESYNIVDPATGEKRDGCPDKYHFNAYDMLEFGERTATAMLDNKPSSSTALNVNVFRKQVNGNTTFDIYFEKKTAGSYNVEYYFNDDGEYKKSSYTKTIASTEENKFFVGDEVSIDTALPSEITDAPSISTFADGWTYDENLSTLKGYVVDNGKLTLKVYYNQHYKANFVKDMKKNGNTYAVSKGTSYNGLGSYYYFGTFASSAFISVKVPANLVCTSSLAAHSLGGICYTDGQQYDTDNANSEIIKGTYKSLCYGVCERGLLFTADTCGCSYGRTAECGNVTSYYYDKSNKNVSLGGSDRILTIALYKGKMYAFIDGRFIYSNDPYRSETSYSLSSSASEYMFGIFAGRSTTIGMSITLEKEIYGTEAETYFENNMKKTIKVTQSILGEPVNSSTKEYKMMPGTTFSIPSEMYTLKDATQSNKYSYDGKGIASLTVYDDEEIFINFDERQETSYRVEYYFFNGTDYVKNDYVKVVNSTVDNPLYVGDSVTIDYIMPTEVTNLPTLEAGEQWMYNPSKSILSGLATKDGALTLKVYYDALNPLDNNYTLAFSYSQNTKYSGQVGTISRTSSNGENIKFEANSWLEYTPNGWGAFMTNGAHWDATFKNIDEIKGIKTITFRIWWSTLYANKESHACVYFVTADNSDLTENKKVTYFNKGEGTPSGNYESFTLDVSEDLPSYFCMYFGDSNSWHFSCIIDMTITYCGATSINA